MTDVDYGKPGAKYGLGLGIADYIGNDCGPAVGKLRLRLANKVQEGWTCPDVTPTIGEVAVMSPAGLIRLDSELTYEHPTDDAGLADAIARHWEGWPVSFAAREVGTE